MEPMVNKARLASQVIQEWSYALGLGREDFIFPAYCREIEGRGHL
jgi:hypothetical protein